MHAKLVRGVLLTLNSVCSFETQSALPGPPYMHHVAMTVTDCALHLTDATNPPHIFAAYTVK